MNKILLWGHFVSSAAYIWCKQARSFFVCFFENSNNKFLALNEEEAKENGSTNSTTKLLIDNDEI